MLELETVSAAAVFALGLRHGIDPDHLAAIGDLVGSQIRARRSMLLATGYALGHAVTLITLSVLAAWMGQLVPQGVIAIMNEIVGVSLIVMGVFLLYSLFRWGARAQLRSRWSLIAQFIRRLVRQGRSSLWRSSTRTRMRPTPPTDTGIAPKKSLGEADLRRSHPSVPSCARTTIDTVTSSPCLTIRSPRAVWRLRPGLAFYTASVLRHLLRSPCWQPPPDTQGTPSFLP